MTQGLSVSDVVNVQINLTPLPAALRNFGTLLLLGSSNVIDVNERIRKYSTLIQVAQDFGVNSAEYAGAVLFFSQKPQPSILYVGRWAQTATAGLLRGAVLQPAQQLMSVFNPISSGAMTVEVDGVPYALQGVNFSSAANLNAVANDVQVALVGAGATGATVVWDSVQQQFLVQSGTTGPLSQVGYALRPTAVGSTAFTLNPSNLQTLTLGGTAVTFVTGAPAANQVQIGASLGATLAALVTVLNASADASISEVNWSVVGTTLYGVFKTPGTGGNAYSLATTVSGATISGATFTGGAGTDIATPMGLTQAAGASAPVIGVAAESLLSCVALMANISSLWYGVGVATATPPSDADYIAVAGLIEGAQPSHIFGVDIITTPVLDSVQTNDLASILKSLGYERTFTQYSGSSRYPTKSIFGRAFTVNFEGSNTTITLKFKQQPGIVAEFLTETQAATLDAKHCNVFVNYDNSTAILQQGVMANGFFFDEVHGTDWLQNRIQTDVYNLLYTTSTKIPQTDAGMNRIANVIEKSCVQGIVNGLGAPGVWNAGGFGQLTPGATLSKGFYVYCPPVATQDEAERAERKTPLFQVAFKLAGAVHFAGVLVEVNR